MGKFNNVALLISFVAAETCWSTFGRFKRLTVARSIWPVHSDTSPLVWIRSSMLHVMKHLGVSWRRCSTRTLLHPATLAKLMLRPRYEASWDGCMLFACCIILHITEVFACCGRL